MKHADINYKKEEDYDTENQIRYLIWGKAADVADSAGNGESERRNGNASGDNRNPVVRFGDYRIVPHYFRWDSFDRRILDFLNNREIAMNVGTGTEKSMLQKLFIRLAVTYFQKRYNKVFLEHTETLFLSERALKEIPSLFWKREPEEMQPLHLSYTRVTFFRILETIEKEGERGIKQMTIVLAIPEECSLTEFEEWMERVQEQDLTRLALTDFILLGTRHQKEEGERLLDTFYEQTGIPGSFYDSIRQYRRGMAERVYIDDSCERTILFLDCSGVPVKEIGRVTFYIDGAGTKSKGEIRKLESTGITCKSLRKYLDSTFLGKL